MIMNALIDRLEKGLITLHTLTLSLQTQVARIILHYEIELRQIDYPDALKKIRGMSLDFAADQN